MSSTFVQHCINVIQIFVLAGKTGGLGFLPLDGASDGMGYLRTVVSAEALPQCTLTELIRLVRTDNNPQQHEPQTDTHTINVSLY